jgi:hypothetical protein
MTKYITALVLLLPLAAESFPAAAQPKSCAEMRKELIELRQAYHRLAGGKDDSGKQVTFDQLAEIVDKITHIKRAMTEADCKIPTRKQSLSPPK